MGIAPFCKKQRAAIPVQGVNCITDTRREKLSGEHRRADQTIEGSLVSATPEIYDASAASSICGNRNRS
jgi:hypothetical protein